MALSNNQLAGEGVSYLLQALTGHQYITSLELMNRDRGSNKLKFGQKGAEALESLLSHPGCILSNLEIAGACLTSAGHQAVANGVTKC